MRALRTVPSRGGSNPTRIPAPLPEAVEAVLPPLQRTGAGSGSEGTNLVPLRQVAGNVICMVRVVQKVDAVVSGLSTNYFVFFLPNRYESRPTQYPTNTSGALTRQPKLLSSSSLRAAKAPRRSESTRPPPTCASAASEPSELPTQVNCQRIRAACQQAVCLPASGRAAHTHHEQGKN